MSNMACRKSIDDFSMFTEWPPTLVPPLERLGQAAQGEKFQTVDKLD